MNILNSAIDQESVDIIVQLQKTFAENPKIVDELVNHSYGRQMQAVHEVSDT